MNEVQNKLNHANGGINSDVKLKLLKVLSLTLAGIFRKNKIYNLFHFCLIVCIKHLNVSLNTYKYLDI